MNTDVADILGYATANSYAQPGREAQLAEAQALLSEADRRLTAIQRVKRDAKRALIENTARDHELAALRQAYTGATAAGFHPELTDDLDTVVQMARNGLVMLQPTAAEVQL